MAQSVSFHMLTLGEPFDQWCAAHGRSRAAALRMLVAEFLASQRCAQESAAPEPQGSAMPAQPRIRGQSRVRPRVQANKDAPAAVKVHLRVDVDEAKRLHAQAKAAGLSVSGFVMALLNAAEAGQTAVAGKEAVRALIESNDEMARIGRLLIELEQRCRSGAAGGANGSWEDVGPQLVEAIGPLRSHLQRAAAVLLAVEQARLRPSLQRYARTAKKRP